MQLAITEWIAIITFLLGLLVFGLYLRGTTGDAAGLFLAGRSLPPWAQAFSTVSTNLNANDFLGLAGLAYVYGLVILGGTLGNALAMLLATLLIIPFIRRLRAFSLGEWFSDRFASPVGVLYDGIWTFVWMVVNMGLYIYAGSLVLNTLLGWPLWIAIGVVVLVGTTYTLLGGFGAVAGSDQLQFLLMFIPLMLLVPISLDMVGGVSGLLDGLQKYQSSVAPVSNPLGEAFPLSGSFLNAVFLYLGFLALSISYWSSESQILQRPLSARDVQSAQMGYLYAGMWYAILVPLVIIIPGTVAAVLFPNLDPPDKAMPTLIAEAMPPGLVGVVIVGLLAAVLSSIDSQLNNFQTLFTQRFYRQYFRPSRPEGHYVRVGRVVGAIFMVVCIGMAYIFSKQPLMFLFAISILGIIMPTFASVALLGGLWDRVTTKGALAGIVFGLAWSLFLAFMLGHEQIYPRALYTIPAVMAVVVIASLLTSPNEGEVPTGFLRAVRENRDVAIPAQVRRVGVAVIVLSVLIFVAFGLVFGF